MVEDLICNAPMATSNIVVHRNELLLVVAAGPGGNPGRPITPTSIPSSPGYGPMKVRGLIHALSETDSIDSLRPMQTDDPLTDAAIAFSIGTTHDGVTRMSRS
jgi:hypothetical protein